MNINREKAYKLGLKIPAGNQNFARYRPNYSPVHKSMVYKNFVIDNG